MAQLQAKPEFEIGDYVSWRYGAGKATGYIVEKLTEPAKLGSKNFQASPDEPKYKIRSDKSGKMAIRNPETLVKIKDGEHEHEDDDRNHDQNGAEEDEELHVEDVEDVHEVLADHDAETEELNGHEDGDQNGSRKKQKSEPVETTVNVVPAADQADRQLGDVEEEKTNGTEKEQTNGKHELEKEEELEVDAHESKGTEEAPHKLPHEEVPQPGQFTDLEVAKTLHIP